MTEEINSTDELTLKPTNGQALPMIVERVVEEDTSYILHVAVPVMDKAIEVAKVQKSPTGTWCLYLRAAGENETFVTIEDIMATIGPIFERPSEVEGS